MRVTSVAMYSSLYSEMIEFSLRQVDHEARYIARAIMGLDAEELTPKFYGYGQVSKDKFYDFGMKPRDIVMRIVLNPQFRLGETYSDIRDDLYRAISANRTGQTTLQFRSGGATVAKIDGMVTKFEVGYFNQLPEVQLTIRCNDPMFRGISPVTLDASEIAPTNNPMIISDTLSTAPHGFAFDVIVTATNIAQITIQDSDAYTPEWFFQIKPFTGGFITNDHIYYSSEYSNKQLYYVRGGVTTHLADAITRNSVWPLIFPGLNSFYFQDRNSFSVKNFTYYPAYWGI